MSDMDPEAERPRNYTEDISSDHSWDTYGIRIKWTEPVVPGDLRVATNEPIKLRVCVETRKDLEVPPEALTAWCWTPVITRENPCGIWKEIKLHYNPKCTQWNDHGVTSYVFQSHVIPLKNDNYRLTFNVKYERIMIWANYFQVDNVMEIQQKPSVGTQTTIHPSVHFSCNFSDKRQTPEQSYGDDPSHGGRRPRKGADDGSQAEDLEMLVLI